VKTPNYRRLVLLTLDAKGPMTDGVLAWWIRVALKGNPSSALKMRRRLTADGLVQ